jgi:hypothetical protein
MDVLVALLGFDDISDAAFREAAWKCGLVRQKKDEKERKIAWSVWNGISAVVIE